jgi:hypothetical protein
MIILVNGATRTVERYPEVGCLIQPRKTNSIDRIATSGRFWAADNDCFQGLDADAYWRMVIRISEVDRLRLLWVACPDVVADAQETVNRWFEWFPQLDYLDLPCAFVGQDGLEKIPDEIPWDQMACLFIGGSTTWKLSDYAQNLMREAKARGKLVHVGRVNTRRRVRDILLMCSQTDSIDGTGFSAWPDKIPKGLRWIHQTETQACLF